LTKGFIKKIKFFESKPSVLFLLLHNELTFICAKKEKKRKENQTKQNQMFLSKKIGTRIGGSIEQQEPNNIV
jgi:hypothetical protein